MARASEGRVEMIWEVAARATVEVASWGTAAEAETEESTARVVVERAYAAMVTGAVVSKKGAASSRTVVVEAAAPSVGE